MHDSTTEIIPTVIIYFVKVAFACLFCFGCLLYSNKKQTTFVPHFEISSYRRKLGKNEDKHANILSYEISKSDFGKSQSHTHSQPYTVGTGSYRTVHYLQSYMNLTVSMTLGKTLVL